MELWTEAAAAIRTAKSLESRGQDRSGGDGRGAGLPVPAAVAWWWRRWATRGRHERINGGRAGRLALAARLAARALLRCAALRSRVGWGGCPPHAVLLRGHSMWAALRCGERLQLTSRTLRLTRIYLRFHSPLPPRRTVRTVRRGKNF